MGETGNKQGIVLFRQVVDVSPSVWRTDEGGNRGGRWDRRLRRLCCGLRAGSGSGGVVAAEGEKWILNVFGGRNWQHLLTDWTWIERGGC